MGEKKGIEKMIFLLLMILLAIFLVCILARNEPVELEDKTSKIMVPFYKAATFLYRKVRPFAEKYFYGLRVYLGKLNPGERIEKIEKSFFVKKMVLIIMLLLVGGLLLLLMKIANMQTSEEILEQQLKRNTPYDNGYQVKLIPQIVSDDKSEENNISFIEDIKQRIGLDELHTVKFDTIEFDVAPRKLTEEEFHKILPEFQEKLLQRFLGENESVNQVTENVIFVESIEPYPFTVEWTLDQTSLINHDGVISEDIEEDVAVYVSANIRYEEYEACYEFPILLHKKEFSKEELFVRELRKVLQRNDRESRSEEYIQLPINIDGTEVFWTEEKAENVGLFFVLIIISCVAIFIGGDKDLEKQIKERSEQMLADYPEIVSKITLFIGAGMSVRGAFSRVAMEYKKDKERSKRFRFAYEEMLVAVYEMESGVEEIRAYQNFSSRCQIQKYVKFGALLEQNVRMGGRGLLENLDAEAKDAFEERSNEAQRLGEQAGTKLLLPMFMMLLVVMVMIMVPAFMGI